VVAVAGGGPARLTVKFIVGDSDTTTWRWLAEMLLSAH
jgi:hypothetical protein